jgi:arylsulfatase A-like enzyme|eukprot:COSAG01_NODE_4706_length_4799_cov_68.341277_4_plen_131_part_00
MLAHVVSLTCDVQGQGGAICLTMCHGRVCRGGHRVPGIISWPAVAKGPARQSWDPVVTMDFMATVLEVLGVERPATQASWAFDGVSVLPILRGQTPQIRGIGWMYHSPGALPHRLFVQRKLCSCSLLTAL